jgi:hypothetical protein
MPPQSTPGLLVVGRILLVLLGVFPSAVLTATLGFGAFTYGVGAASRHDYSELGYPIWVVCGGFGLLGLLTSAPRIHPVDFRLRRSETVFLSLGIGACVPFVAIIRSLAIDVSGLLFLSPFALSLGAAFVVIGFAIHSRLHRQK